MLKWFALKGAAQNPARVEAEQLWQRARAALNEHASVQAKLVQDIGLYGQRLMGSGAYLQGPPGYHWVSLDLTIKQKPHDTVLQQRCDGNFLWIYRSADGLARTSRVDVRRVHAAGKAAREGTITPSLGIGGLPKLFDALDKSFQFTEVRREKLDGRMAFVLQGQWRRDRLRAGCPNQEDAIEAGGEIDLTRLPQAIPDHVLIYLDGNDLFPRRIDYRRHDPESRAAGDHSKSLVLLRFSDLVFDAPVDRRSFLFEPGLAPVTDATDQYIHNLGLTPP